MRDWILNNQALIATVLTLALTGIFLLALRILGLLQWGTVEEAIRALTPDEYETLVIRISKTVFDSVKAAGEDITDDQVRKRAAELALMLIGLIANKRLTVHNMDALMTLYTRRGIAVGIVGDPAQDINGMRLISIDLATSMFKRDEAA